MSAPLQSPSSPALEPVPQTPVGHALQIFGLSLLVHLAFLTSATILLPGLLGPGGEAVDVVPPQVLTFRFRDRTADVSEKSRTETPAETPLLGRFDSQAQDRVEGARDTPIPAGGVASGENALPGAMDPRPAGPRPAGDRATPPGPQGAPGRVTETRSGAQPGRIDVAVSELALMTGRPDAPEPGRGARHDAGEDEVGALAFGDYAFSTLAWDYEPFWHHMRERLYANWHPPAAYRDYGIIDGGWTMVRAVLDRKGQVARADVVGEKGHGSLHRSSLAAMLGASPFRSLPAGFPEDSLVVTVRFMYLPPNAPGRRPGNVRQTPGNVP